MPERDERARRELWVSASGARLLERAAEWLRAFPPSAPVWVLAPSAEAAEAALEARLLPGEADLGGRAFSLLGLARALLEGAHEGAHEGGLEGGLEEGEEAGALAREALAARAIRRVEAQGALGPFEAIAAAPGLPRALARLFAELTLHELPEARLAEARPALAALAAAYREEMEAAGLRDRARALAAAAARLEATPRLERGAGLGAGLAAPEAVLLLDLPLRSRAAERLAAALVARSGAAAATMSLADRAGIAALERAFGRPAQALGPTSAGPLARLQAGLAGAPLAADPPEAPAAGAWPREVELLSAASEDRECVEIARGILALAARGVRFEEVGVLLCAPELYAPHLAEALARARIPARFSSGTAHPDPGGRALLSLLRCAAEGLSASAFAEYLSLDVVPDPPEEPGGLHPAGLHPRALPRLWERLIHEAAVIGGLARFRDRLAVHDAELRRRRDRLSDPSGAEAQSLERRLLALSALRAHALPLLADLAALPERARWGEWLDHLTLLAGRALRRPERVFELLTRLAPMAPLGPIDLGELRRVLSLHLGSLRVGAPAEAGGAVWVGRLEEARGRRFAWAFVPGLAEGLFPRKLRDDPLLGEAAREALGAGLPRLRDRAAEERLSLSIAASVAASGVVFSLPRADADRGRARVPSFYALEVLAAATGRLPTARELASRAKEAAPVLGRWAAPREPERAIDDAEYDLAALDRALCADPEARRGAARYLLSANPHLARALRARARRWATARWSDTEGELGPEAREALAPYRLEARPYSATALQRFAACPYRFFLESVMHLVPPDFSPREGAEGVERLTPRDRGSVVHDILFLLFERAAEARLPFLPEREAELAAILEGACDEVGEAYRERLAPRFEGSYRESVAAIRRDLLVWLGRRLSEQPEGGPPAWAPFAAELGFGSAPGARRDKRSASDPVRVAGGLLLSGSIDLVEEREGRLVAVDHKSAGVEAPEGLRVAGGRVLQPVLYALALEALYPEREVPGARLDYCTSEGGFRALWVPLDRAAREGAEALTRALKASFEGAFFPAAPEAGACEACPHRPLCGPHELLRAQRKRPAPLGPLLELRGRR